LRESERAQQLLKSQIAHECFTTLGNPQYHHRDFPTISLLWHARSNGRTPRRTTKLIPFRFLSLFVDTKHFVTPGGTILIGADVGLQAIPLGAWAVVTAKLASRLSLTRRQLVTDSI
jgi:hypothetical protein